MTGEQLRKIVGDVLHEFQYDDGNHAADAVLRAIRAAGLVVAEPSEIVTVESDRHMYRFTNPVVLSQIAEHGLALVRVVE